jgi:hypothetical protein
MINSHTAADFQADYATLFVFLHYTTGSRPSRVYYEDRGGVN